MILTNATHAHTCIYTHNHTHITHRHTHTDMCTQLHTRRNEKFTPPSYQHTDNALFKVHTHRHHTKTHTHTNKRSLSFVRVVKRLDVKYALCVSSYVCLCMYVCVFVCVCVFLCVCVCF